MYAKDLSCLYGYETFIVCLELKTYSVQEKATNADIKIIWCTKYGSCKTEKDSHKKQSPFMKKIIPL